MTVTKNNPNRVDAFTEQAKDTAHAAGEQAKESAGKAADFAGQVADKTRDAARSAVEKAGQMADSMGHRVDDAVGSVGSGLQSLASKVRETAPTGSMFSSVADQAASGLERTGDYLRHEGASGLSKDLTSLVRTHPIPAVLIGLACGYLLARATRE